MALMHRTPAPPTVREESTMRRTILAVVLAGAVLLGGLGLTPPAGATPATDQKYVTKLFEDFLGRPPSSGDLTYWTGYLGTHTRTQFVTAILTTSEFDDLWMHGVFSYYLQDYDSDVAPFTTARAALTTTSNYVASEVTAIASSAYFTRAGGTNGEFVETVYEDVLRRTVDGPGLTYWTDRLVAGTSTRSSFANYVIRSTESVNLRIGGLYGSTSCSTTTLEDEQGLTAGTYCVVLDRMADAGGVSFWAPRLAATDQLPTMWISFAATSEYYDLAQL